MCPNCGSCFSKKSNLYNHLHRGKGCPKREDKEEAVTARREVNVRPSVINRQKINFAEIKDEAIGDSDDDELSDLIIDDRNQSIKEEEEEEAEDGEEEEIDDEERLEEQVEES